MEGRKEGRKEGQFAKIPTRSGPLDLVQQSISPELKFVRLGDGHPWRE